MALFGRRKPGFSKEETLKPSEIPSEFNDALDPAMKSSDQANPKHREKTEYAAKADEVIGTHGEEQAAQEAPSTPAKKQDLFDYMESLPEVADPFAPMEAEAEQEDAAKAAPTEAEKLAAFIRERTKGAVLTPLSELRKEDEQIDMHLAAMKEDQQFATIVFIQGAKDAYYYDNDIMTDNYAHIAALIADKDIPHTIAEMVRWNCKTYPSPTPQFYFTRHPYYLTKPQIAVALQRIEKSEQYSDIKQFNSAKGTPFLYSDKVLSARYARALADGAEDDENS